MLKYRLPGLCIVFLIIIPVFPLFSNDVEDDPTSWFNTFPEAEGYGRVKADILDILIEAERSGVPVRLLMSKMKEGAAKGIPPQRLVEALKQEGERLKRALDIIEAAGYMPAIEGDALAGAAVEDALYYPPGWCIFPTFGGGAVRSAYGGQTLVRGGRSLRYRIPGRKGYRTFRR